MSGAALRGVRALQPPDDGAIVRVLGCRAFDVDLAAAESRYKDLSQLHPDRFAKARAARAASRRCSQAADAERRLARSLHDPGAARRVPARARRASPSATSDEPASRSPALLMEMLELREELAEAQRGRRRRRGRAAWRDAMRGAPREAHGRRCAALFAAGRRSTRRARALIALRYYDRFLDEVRRRARRGRQSEAMADAAADLRAGRVARPRRPAQARAVGIDLGTTNSLVAHRRATRRRSCLRDERRARSLLPSVVHYAADGGDRRRREARAGARAEHPRDTHRLGEALHGPRAARRRGDAQAHAVRVRRRRATRPTWCASPSPAARAVTPIEVSAEILRALQARAPRPRSAAPLDGAVITVPAYFDDAPAPGDARRRAARRARGAAPAQRADRGGAGLRPRQAGRRAPSPSSISAAARSTSRS